MFRSVRLLLFATVITTTSAFERKIIGGYPILVNERPFQVSLFYKNRFSCAGSIISPRWILTAAHCLKNKKYLEVHAGSVFKDHYIAKFLSAKLIAHPKYDRDSHDFDVGLIDLGSDVIPLDNVTMKAIALAEPGVKIGDNTEVDISGWGRINDRGMITKILMRMVTFTQDRNTCKGYYDFITDRMHCIVPGNAKTCHGDSGGPVLLEMEMTQVGIVSFGYKKRRARCDYLDYPSVFTNVGHPVIRNWITTLTGI